MKTKLFYLCCLLFAAGTSAQSISSKDLIGSWKVNSISTPELSVDLKTMEVTLTPETVEWAKKKKKNVEDIKKAAIKNAKEYIDKVYYFDNKGICKEKKGAEKPTAAEYELKNSGGQNVITLYYPDGDYEDLFYVSYTSGKLYLEYDEAEVTLVCEKGQ